ncbi:ATP-binding protein [soil metagenome]
MQAKNLSSKQVAAFTALPIALITALSLKYAGISWLESGIVLVLLFLCGYLFISFMLKQFVDHKIKLIYKLIYQTKASKKEEFYYKSILPQKTIHQVQEEVNEWAKNRSEEIDELRKNEAYRKEFLLNLSHELKTPIFAIQGYVDTLLNGALHNNNVNEKFLSHAGKNVERLVNLVDDLDQISKLESGEQQLFPSTFVIQDLIKEVFESLSLKFEVRKIKSTIKKECELPVYVYADKEKIRQVLINLVDNAIKYGKQNGYIEASIYKTEEKKVLVEISDNGEGISEEHLPRIFERFYRTDEARTRKVGGSGLGLSICKHIIEAHGETLHVRSKPTVGSSFGFTLAARKD